MTNMIACANDGCDNVIEVAGATVTLPLFCSECQEAIDFQSKIAPETTAYPPSAEGEEEHDGCGCEDSQAANAIIADLQEQLKRAEDGVENAMDSVNNALSDLQTANAAIDELNDKVGEQQAVIEDRDERINNLVKGNIELVIEKTDLKNELEVVTNALADASEAEAAFYLRATKAEHLCERLQLDMSTLFRRIDDAKAENAKLTIELKNSLIDNADQQVRIDNAKRTVERLTQLVGQSNSEVYAARLKQYDAERETYFVRRELERLQKRGFWARLFNAKS